MNELYPLKFNPIILDKMWGGSKLRDILNKPTASDKAGESWELSGVDGNLSEVSNGFLEGNNLEELVEVYMGDLVGDAVYDRFGNEFPLLIKFIDANDYLSIQVHPDDELAKKRHNSFGKTEMWYIMQANEGAELLVGFNQKVNKQLYLQHLQRNTLTDILHHQPVKPGEVYFLPAGRVHAIGSGILLAEIQQTSDITYRIYDFDRRDTNGNPRELHTDLALDAIDYNFYDDYATHYANMPDIPVPIVSCDYFTTNKIVLTQKCDRDVAWLDSFVIYICLEGSCSILSENNENVILSKGETVLIPASIDTYTIEPGKSVCNLLEVFIDSPSQK